MLQEGIGLGAESGAFLSQAQSHPLEQVGDADNGMDYPAMVYDGAFSDARRTGVPRALGSTLITPEQAVVIARRIVGEERVQSAEAGVSAGGVIPLETTLANAQYFTNNAGSILIRRAGTYLVTYTVQVPIGEALASQYYLTLNGTAVNESAVNVTDNVSAEETKSYTMQAIIQANANSTLALNSSAAVTADAAALNPYNLTIVRLA